MASKDHGILVEHSAEVYVVAPSIRKLIGDRKLLDVVSVFPERFAVTNRDDGVKRRNVLRSLRAAPADVATAVTSGHGRFVVKKLAKMALIANGSRKMMK